MRKHGQRLLRSILVWATAAATLLATMAVGVPSAWASPTVTITSPQDGQTVTSASVTVQGSISGTSAQDTVTGTVSVNGGASQSLTVTGSTFTGTATLLAGANSISVTITATNTQTGSTSGTATESVTLQTAPVVTLTSVSGSGTTVTFSGTVSDTTVTQATVIYNNQTLKTIPVNAGSFSSFVENACGTPALAVAATNGAGSSTSATQTVTGLSQCSSSTAVGGGGGGVVYTSAPTVGGISPSSGPAAGGTAVTITGSGFTGATAVDFGTTTATAVTVASDTQIQATSPAGSGTVDVTVVTPAGTSATSSADRFTYTAAAAAAAAPAAGSFPDVPSSFWAYSAIHALAVKGIISGFPDGTFRPNAPVSRAQFVKMLVLTLGLTPGSGTTPFKDVTAGDWFAPYVATAVQQGIVQGLTPTSFGPNRKVTREQMAVLLARAMKLTKTAALRFSDAGAVAPWALQGVEETVAAGYINGFPNGTFQPTGTTTRAQAAKVLAMVLSRQGS